jgi:hypothetical protein
MKTRKKSFLPDLKDMIPTRRAFWRSFRMAAWLGWQIESNWTDPFLFAVYSIIKPLAGAAILVVMYGIITKGNFEDPCSPTCTWGMPSICMSAR